MIWHLAARSQSPGIAAADVDHELVSDGQLSGMCIACTVRRGRVQLIFADGHFVSVPQHLIPRSNLLHGVVDLSFGLSDGSLLHSRAFVHSWIQYLHQSPEQRQALSTLALFRHLQV
jgi:hypothetical protein